MNQKPPRQSAQPSRPQPGDDAADGSSSTHAQTQANAHPAHPAPSAPAEPSRPSAAETPAQTQRRHREARKTISGEESGVSSTTRVAVNRRTIVVRLPDGWARALLCGIEACIFGWGIVMLFAIVAYWAIAANPWLGEMTWQSAIGLSGDAWAVTQGGAAKTGAAAIRVMPLVVAAVDVLILRGLLAGGRAFSPNAQWASIVGYTITAVILAGVSADHTPWWSVIPGAIVISGIAAAWAYLSHLRPWESAAPGSAAYLIWRGLHQALLGFAAVLVMALVAMIVAVAAGAARIHGIRELLSPSVVDEVALGVAEAAFLPNALAWTASWLAGPGFVIGADAVHSPASAPIAPIPAIPMLGAMPETSLSIAVVLIPIAVGVGIGALAAWRFREDTVRAQAIVAAAAVVGFAVLVVFWMATSTMVLGDGRLAHVGPRIALATLLLTLEVMVVAQAVAIMSHPDFRSRARAAAGTGLGEVREFGHGVAAKLEERRGGTGETGASEDRDPPSSIGQ